MVLRKWACLHHEKTLGLAVMMGIMMTFIAQRQSWNPVPGSCSYLRPLAKSSSDIADGPAGYVRLCGWGAGSTELPVLPVAPAGVLCVSASQHPWQLFCSWTEDRPAVLSPCYPAGISSPVWG